MKTTLAPAATAIIDLYLSVAVAILAVGAVSLFAARHYGGKSRQKRRAIFGLTSALGVLLVVIPVIVLKLTGRA